MTFRTRVFATVGGWIVFVSALVLIVPLRMRDRLPEPMASHWGPNGQPDDAMPFTGFLMVTFGMWVLVLVCGLGCCWGEGIYRRGQRITMAITLAAGGVLALGVSWTSVLSNLDAPHWKQASPMTWPMLVVLGACLLAALLGWLMARTGPNEQATAKPKNNTPEVRLTAGERVTWISAASNTLLRWLAFGSVLVPVAAFLLMGEVQWLVIVTSGPVALIGLGLSSVRVQVHEQGVRIAFGPQRWPTRRIPLDRLAGAYTQHRKPSEVGGWGYRGWPSAATIMIRGGECLVLKYRSGGELGISLDDAERGAALINSLVAERAATTGGEE